MTDRGAPTAMPPSPAEVVVDLVGTERDAREAVGLLAAVWTHPGGGAPLQPELVWAFAHSGNYVAVARCRREVVAAAVGFRGADDGGPYLHSHIAGVRPDWRGSSVGYALKQHQRSWALGAGLGRITWTFDPLVARNAYFNLTKLGARLTRYYVDFYGPLEDGVNDGDATDRVLVSWPAGRPAASPDLPAVGGRDLLSVGPGGGPLPRPDEPAEPGVRLVRLPVDIVELRRRDPALARAWRSALRDALLGALADGYQVAGATRDSCYVLVRGPGR